MGIRDWLNVGFNVSVRTNSSDSVTPIALPDGPQTPVNIIETMLTHAASRSGRWQATFDASEGRTVQVLGDRIFTPTEIDLPDIARRLGLTALAEQITVGGHARAGGALHMVPDAAPGEIAALVDAIFRLHHDLPENYPFRASAKCV